MAVTRTRLGPGPTLVVLAGLLAGLGSTVSAGSLVAEASRPAAPRTDAPVDGGSAHNLALPDLQGPGLDGATLPSDAEVAVESATATAPDPDGFAWQVLTTLATEAALEPGEGVLTVRVTMLSDLAGDSARAGADR